VAIILVASCRTNGLFGSDASTFPIAPLPKDLPWDRHAEQGDRGAHSLARSISVEPSGRPANQFDQSYSGGIRDRKPITSITVRLPDGVANDPTVADPAMTGGDHDTVVTEYPVSEHWRFTFGNPGLSMCHHPLYFEDVRAERFGACRGWLDVPIAAAHFYGTIPIVPYKMGLVRPWECVSSTDMKCGFLGNPGCYPPRRRIAAGVLQAGAATGLVFVLP
jgi:hypothetical protein